MMYARPLVVLAVAILAGGSPEALRSVDATGRVEAPRDGVARDALRTQGAPAIRNFLQVNDDFCTGGQPRPEHLATLKARGVKAVLNLRTPGEHRAAEEQADVEKLGLKYFNIPVVYTAPTDAQVEEFLRITDDPANRPMFIHCTSAIRVGAFWAIRRVMRDGMTVDQALEEARKVGLTNAPHLDDFVRAYASRHRE